VAYAKLRVEDCVDVQPGWRVLGRLVGDEGSRRLGELGIGCNPGITLRATGSRIELDGEVVQRDGAWLV
jgi:leucyl aminopeptidase (aminopeptidase T)